GVSSVEEFVAGADPTYEAATLPGSLVLFYPDDGRIILENLSVGVPQLLPGDGGPSTPPQRGPSGGPLSCTPTSHPGTHPIYAATGNNYSPPTTDLSDALVAFDATDGHIKWVNQLTANDEWTLRFPQSEEHPDFDIGDSPQLYRLNGRLVVGAGQKSGFFHVV